MITAALFITTCMNIENHMLCGGSQTQGHIFYDPIYVVCTGCQIHKENRLVVDKSWEAKRVINGSDC